MSMGYDDDDPRREAVLLYLKNHKREPMKEITPPGPTHSMPDPNPSPERIANRLRIHRLGHQRNSSYIMIPAELIDQAILALETDS